MGDRDGGEGEGWGRKGEGRKIMTCNSNMGKNCEDKGEKRSIINVSFRIFHKGEYTDLYYYRGAMGKESSN